MENSIVIHPESIEKTLKEFPECENVLKSLFPHYFIQKNTISVQTRAGGSLIVDQDNIWLVAPRAYGTYTGKAFYLNPKYNWTLVTDDHNTLLLLPLKK